MSPRTLGGTTVSLGAGHDSGTEEALAFLKKFYFFIVLKILYIFSRGTEGQRKKRAP